MIEFCQLYRRLDETTKTNDKLEAMCRYFQSVPATSAAWAVYVMTGRRLKRLIKHGDFRSWGAEFAGIPGWLFEECYHEVGDLSETLSLVSANRDSVSDESSEQDIASESLADWFEYRILPLEKMDEMSKRQHLFSCWSGLTIEQRFVFNKLIGGGLRVGVSKKSVVKAIAMAFNLEPNLIAHRLMGEWQPTADWFNRLIDHDETDVELSRPYPFCLAYPLEQEVSQLGDIQDWHAEWKWDGIRAQIIRRGDRFSIWSRGEELLNDRFPELSQAIKLLPPGTVLDGELLVWKDGKVKPFADLQTRIGRKNVGRKILQDNPVRFLAFDVLEWQGEDFRETAFDVRRSTLNELFDQSDFENALMLPPKVDYESWDDLSELREGSRELGVEGLMLKHKESKYEVGRVSGTWWKWKIEPYTIDAVLVYAQAGHGRRASLFTDYTFGLWENGELVPFAKAYSGLTDKEIRRVDNFIKKNTLERFGPVRVVKPDLVFELAFENIQFSKRHKSGIAVRFPRIHRWREDKVSDQANTLDDLKAMIPSIQQLASDEKVSTPEKAQQLQLFDFSEVMEGRP